MMMGDIVEVKLPHLVGMVKLADTLDLGSNAEKRAGSSPVTDTMAHV